ncbi:MAG: PEP/pyruvate-binding domain-containing protein [Myxococcota bacterium]
MISLAIVIAAVGVDGELSDADIKRAKGWVEEMKTNRRGPYEGVMWFCADGMVLPPKSYACVEHGGGEQYGILKPEAKKLGALGIYVGTILTALSLEEFTDGRFYRGRAYIVESFLERALDGWTLKKAKSFRGFRQIEDEEESARKLLIPILRKATNFNDKRSLMLRMIRALPYGRQGAMADEIRSLAGVIGDADPEFAELRYKIHALPEPTDIVEVEAYAKAAKRDEWKAQATDLVEKMRRYYDAEQRMARLNQVRQWLRDDALREQISVFTGVDAKDSLKIIAEGAKLMVAAENTLLERREYVQGERNLLALHVMELVEQVWISVTADLSRRMLSRRAALDLLTTFIESAHRLAYLSEAEQASALAAVATMRSGKASDYAAGLEQASRILDWAAARVVSDVAPALERYERVEPRAVGVVDDILRSGVMLPAAKLLDRLAVDVEALRGGGHQLLGISGSGTTTLRGENAGISTGTLRYLQLGENTDALRRDDIVLLRGLPPELPPVAGIITIGSAGKLSHISVLARNLGIPHASVGGDIAEKLLPRVGERFLLAVSAGRRVAMGPLKSFDESLQAELTRKARIIDEPFLEIEADELALEDTQFRLLGELKDGDSGRICGPKAAELGRLKRIFPERVSDGVVIPFGVFVEHVNRAGAKGEPSPLRRLQYFLELTKRMPAERSERIMLKELARFREQVATLPFRDGFVAEVERQLGRIGSLGRFGVFVRSDTNVEDLREFTGAGLNKTVPHRVGLPSILAAIKKVWASPYTERSYRWRQRVLVNPEYVFPSVILHRTVPAVKSGVLVTTDLETGTRNAITISAGEGVAAVVDGGSPQTVVLGDSGWERLVSSCRATTRKEIPTPPKEGVVVKASEGLDPLLGASELAELKSLAEEVLQKFPTRGSMAPWDIEWGLLDGQAWLMQIRPLKVSRAASTHPYLRELDKNATLTATTVALEEPLP